MKMWKVALATVVIVAVATIAWSEVAEGGGKGDCYEWTQVIEYKWVNGDDVEWSEHEPMGGGWTNTGYTRHAWKKVEVPCEEPTTTTTEQVTTTTTEQPTTTTAPPATTTTTEPVTTTTVPEVENDINVTYRQACDEGLVVTVSNAGPGTEAVRVMDREQYVGPGGEVEFVFDLPAKDFTFTVYVDWGDGFNAGQGVVITDIGINCDENTDHEDVIEQEVTPPSRDTLPNTGWNWTVVILAACTVAVGAVGAWFEWHEKKVAR